jgi:serine protease Do
MDGPVSERSIQTQMRKETMSRPTKNPRNPYILIASGFGLGALCMGAAYNSAISNPAFAQLGGAPTRTISATNAESVAELKNLDASYVNLADFVAPAVVDIKSTNTGRKMDVSGERIGQSGGEGSGFIFRPDGYIITNDHVVGGFDEVKVVLKNGREFKGKVTRAQDSDIAIVKIEANNLPTLALADSARVRAGQTVMAVGAPFGLEQSVTFGHISALARTTTIENRLYPDLIQTDASINMGNSGGPLVNINGQVVGVNTSILSPSGTSAGIGFAIPSNQVRFIAEMLVNKGKITRSMLGIIPRTLKPFEKQDLNLANGGAMVEEVPSNGAAAMSGIQKGDVIVKVGTTPITNEVDLRNSMLVYEPGKNVPVEVIRRGEHKTFSVKLTEYKAPKAPTGTPFNGGRGFQFPKGLDPFKDMPGFKIPKDFQELPGDGDSSGDSAPIRSGPHAILGVSIGEATPEIRNQYHIPADTQGAVVGSVSPGSAADKLGLQVGDVIVLLGSKAITNAKDLSEEMSKVKWGETRTVKYLRYGDGSQVVVQRDVKF